MSLPRLYLNQDADLDWLITLEAGDSMAHFGLGDTLYELGRHG